MKINLCALKCTYKTFVGSLDIAPTRNFTYFLKIGFVVAGGGFYSYCINQGNKSDNERKTLRKKLSFMHTKRFNVFFKTRVQFQVYHIRHHLEVFFHLQIPNRLAKLSSTKIFRHFYVVSRF